MTDSIARLNTALERRSARMAEMRRAGATLCTSLLTIILLAGPAMGQDPSMSTCPATGIHVQILGSGGPGNSAGRASSAYLIWIDGTSPILIDAGGGTKDHFHQSGASMAEVGLLALTHLHPDHSSEVPALLWPGGADLRVSGPTGDDVFPSIDEFLDRLLGSRGAFPILSDRSRLDVFPVDVSRGEPTVVWQEGNVSVAGLGVPHGGVPTVGYRIEVGGASIAFSSDQNGSDPGFVDFVRGVDVLVIHLSGAEDSTGLVAELHARPSVWGQMAADAGVGHLIVSHISTSSEEELDVALGFLRQNYDGPLTIGEDLMCFSVPD